MTVVPADTDAESARESRTCDHVFTAAVDRAEAERIASLLKAISDPTRIQLLSLLLAAPNGEACVCDLTEPLGFRQPTISRHLRILVEAGLLKREKRANWVYYSVLPGRLDPISQLLR